MICCVTGHRPKGFPFQRDSDEIAYMLYLCRLHMEIEKLIREGYTHFITGMAEGADIDFANAVLYFRDTESFIMLEAALPYPRSPRKRPSDYGEMCDEILMSCDRKTVVSPCYHKGCMQKRNCYMVDKSDIVLAIWNGRCEGGTWNTIRYAQTKGKTIRYIMLDEIARAYSKY